jgi:hypothetical protein
MNILHLKNIRAILNLVVKTLVATGCERIFFQQGCNLVYTRNYLVDMFSYVTKASRVHRPKERNKPCTSPYMQINSCGPRENPN